MKDILPAILFISAVVISVLLHSAKYSNKDSGMDTIRQELIGMPLQSSISVKIYGDLENGEEVRQQIRYVEAPLPICLFPNNNYKTILYVSAAGVTFHDTAVCTTIWKKRGILRNYHLIHCP